VSGGAAFAALDVVRRAPRRAGVFTDFDGTLSPIVADPSAARPVTGGAEAVTALARAYGRVGVLSGRPVAFLQPFFGPEVVLAGLYGLETVIDGIRRDHPLGGAWREVVEDVAANSDARGPEGMRVEAKGLSITLHYRGRPEREPEVRAWAEQQAVRSGLDLRPARMSYELHPPIEVDKGTTLLELAEGLGAVAFLGDDVGDLPAFDALDRMAAAGADTVRVGVRSGEGAPELLERADLVVDGPTGVLAVLEDLGAPRT
jgi:trehalose 6-phosphate phosphatase